MGMGWRMYKERVDEGRYPGRVDVEYVLGIEGTGSRVGNNFIDGCRSRNPEELARVINEKRYQIPRSLIEGAKKDSQNGVVRGEGLPGPFTSNELERFLSHLDSDLIS